MDNKREKGNLKLYGIVEGHKNISFVIDDFQCVFINSVTDKKGAETITTIQGFIIGKTTENKYVYIHAGKDLQIWEMLTLNTWLYFVGHRSNIVSFDAISFQGGVLNKLFFKSALEFDYSDPTKLIYNDDRKKYFLKNKKIKGEMLIHSIISKSMSIEKGNSIAITGTELEIIFDEKKDISSFSELFGYILTLCQFMTFRKNVKFEKIFLEEKPHKFPEINETLFDCFVRYDDEKETDKRIMSCITFNDIGDSIDKLLNSIVSNQPKKPQFNVGFIPENDKNVTLITSMKIREVCSALESEMELAKITVEQEKEFNVLVDELKKMVKAHRDGETPLTDTKAYDYILGDLRHLKGALADRIEKCFLQHQQELGEFLNRKQIDEIVGYRNTITHGSYMQLNEDLADTTFILMKLVYCCILERIGMSQDKVKDLMKRHVTS